MQRVVGTMRRLIKMIVVFSRTNRGAALPVEVAPAEQADVVPEALNLNQSLPNIYLL